MLANRIKIKNLLENVKVKGARFKALYYPIKKITNTLLKVLHNKDISIFQS